MKDLIDRSAFDKFLNDAEIEAVKRRKYVLASAINNIRGNLKTFPSAQPEILAHGEGELSAQLDLQSTCTDLISRQAAIDTLNFGAELLKRALDDTDIVGGERETCERELELIEACISDMKELPPAQPERKTGKWIPDNRVGGGFWVCSCCKFPSEAFAADKIYKYCPNCGAKMEGNT